MGLLICLFSILGCRKNDTVFATEYVPMIFFSEFQIISPKQGDVWRIGETYEIKWIPSSRARFVKIELYRKNTLRKIIAQQTENNGSFFYSIPLDSEISNLFRIKIINLNDPNEFVLSNYFSIR